MPSASRARADAMSASDIRTAPLLAEAWHRARRGQIVGPRHARPQAGAVRGSGPAASGEFDHACARCRRNARSGRRNRCFDRTKEHGSASIRACRGGRSLDTVTCPIGGETENASHTEILTLPLRSIFTATSRATQLFSPTCRRSERAWNRSQRPGSQGTRMMNGQAASREITPGMKSRTRSIPGRNSKSQRSSIGSSSSI
jgi:hypothetical protein